MAKEKEDKKEQYSLDLTTTKGKKEAFLFAYRDSNGCISVGCRVANIHPETYFTDFVNDPEFNKELSYVNLVIKDKVRKELFAEIEKGNMTAIKFFFETDGLANFSDKSVQATLQVIHEDILPKE